MLCIHSSVNATPRKSSHLELGRDRTAEPSKAGMERRQVGDICAKASGGDASGNGVAVRSPRLKRMSARGVKTPC